MSENTEFLAEMPGASPLRLQTILSHNTLKATPSDQVCYVLLDISPATDLPTQRLPVNLSLVLDKGEMRAIIGPNGTAPSVAWPTHAFRICIVVADTARGICILSVR